MIIIETLSSQRFTLNGIEYFKNYLSEVAGDKIRIYNAYDKCDVKLDWTSYGSVELDGVTYGSVGALQSALLPVIYTRLNLGTDGGFNNVNNRFIALGNITRSVNTFTFTSGFAWIINSSSYVTTTNTNIVVEEATTDNFRIDIVVANTLGELVLIQGEESEDVALQPIVPANTLFLCAFNIFGDIIGSNTEPVLGLDFVKKIYYSEFQFVAPIDVISLPLVGMTGFVFEAGDFNLKGFTIETSAELYEGKEFSLKNNSDEVITLEHYNLSVDIWFNFINEANGTLQPNEIKFFRYNKLRGLELKGSNLSGTTPTLQEVTTEGNETTNSIKVVLDANNYVEINPETGITIPFSSGLNDLVLNILGQGITLTDNNSSNQITISPFKIDVIGNKESNIFSDKLTCQGIDYFYPVNESGTFDLTPIIVNANKTAENDAKYTVIANATFTDPTPAEGKGYTVFVRNGTATIGGVGYTAGSLVYRFYHSGAWETYNQSGYVPLSGTTTGNPITGDIEMNSFSSIKAENTTYQSVLNVDVDNNLQATLYTTNKNTGDISGFGTNSTNGFSVYVSKPSETQNVDINVTIDGIVLTDDGTSQRGLQGAGDYSANITDLDYAQKIYVDAPSTQNQSQRSTSTSGTDIINDTGRNIIFIHEAGTTTTLTINLPDTPVNNQIVTIMSVGGVVGLTLSTAVGTIIGTVTSLTALIPVKFIWLASESKWYKI